MINDSDQFGFFWWLIKQLLDASDKVQKISLSEEFKLILNAITYTRFSPEKGRSYINLIPCKKDIVSLAMDRKPISILNNMYDRSWVWRCRKDLVGSQVLVEDDDGNLYLSGQLPGFIFIQHIKNLNKFCNSN